MANLLVIVELRGGHPTPPSLFAVAEGRRLADAVGATVYTLCLIGPETPAELEGIGTALGAAGADKAWAGIDRHFGGLLIDATAGPLIHEVVKKLAPRLVLLPAGPAGGELGPPLAVRAGARFFPRAAITVLPATAHGRPTPTLELGRVVADEVETFATTAENLVVTTLGSGASPAGAGGTPVELELLSEAAPPPPGTALLGRTRSSTGDAELARTLVLMEGNDAPSGAAPGEACLPPDGKETLRAVEVACPERLVAVAVKDVRLLESFRPTPAGQLAWAGGKTPPRGAPPAALVWTAPAKRATAAFQTLLAGPQPPPAADEGA